MQTIKARKRFFRGMEFAYANHEETAAVKEDAVRNEEIVMPLVLAPIGVQMKIVRIVADEKTKKHLSNLGVLVQANITVLSSAGGSAVCLVKDGRLALDKNIAAHIFVA